MQTRQLLGSVCLLLASAASNVALAHADHSVLQLAMKGEHRTDKNQARDKYRHPAQTLEFFGLKPGMSVVEIWPGGGWYTEVIAPVLKDNGTLYAAHFPESTPSDYFKKSRAKFEKKVAKNPTYKAVKVTEFHTDGSESDIAPKGSADMVLTFRNLHNWYMRKGDSGVNNAFKSFYAALKPGGVLGLVDHRLPEDRAPEEWKKSGYVKESWVIEFAKKAGFTLEAKSEINANAKDAANHPKGVWTLPPRLALGDTDKDKYLAIGESDRMTLKFRKPAK